MLQLFLPQFSQKLYLGANTDKWVFRKGFWTISWNMQFSEDCLHYLYLKKVVALPFVVQKLLLGKRCFTMLYERSKNQLYAVYLHGDITVADWGCADIWWLISSSLEFDDVLKPVLWKRWWFTMIDSAGLKKQEPTIEGYNGWGKERLSLSIGLKAWWQKYENCKILIGLCTLHYYYQAWSHMAWLATLWKQKLSFFTLFPKTYW